MKRKVTIHLKRLLCGIAALQLVLWATIALAQTQYDTSPGAQTGIQIFGSYFDSDIDTIGVYNGNVMLNINLFSVPGRELSSGLGLSYNSQKWEQQNCGGYTCWVYTGGWRISNVFGSDLNLWATYLDCVQMDAIYFPRYELNGYWIDGRGTKHRYFAGPVLGWQTNEYDPACSESWANWETPLQSVDSDGSTLYVAANYPIYNEAHISFKDGLQRWFQVSYYNQHYVITPNGNGLTRRNDASGLPISDTLGRVVTYVDSLSSGGYDTYTVTDANGVPRVYKINYAWNRSIINSIELPNGKTYQFQYNHPHGYLTKVILPSGAYISYSYVTPTSYGNDWVIERRVSADGNPASEKIWTYSGGTQNPERWITVTSPEGDQVDHGFNAQGEEYFTQWRSAAGPVLRTVNSSWSQTAILSNGQPNNARTNTITTVLDGGMQSVKTITYDTNMSVTGETVTDWAGNLISQKGFGYQTINGTFPRLSSEWLGGVDPASGSFVTQGYTAFFYDDYPVTFRGYGNPSQANRGNLTRVRRYKDINNYVEEQLRYDNLGNMIQKTDPLGHVTNIDFTDNFSDNINRNTFAYPKSVTNPLGHAVTTKYNFATGLPVQVTNPRGQVTTTAYDLLNRVTSVTEPNSKQTTYAYDDTLRITTKEVTVDAVGNKGRVKTYFDGLYRVTQTRTNDPEGDIFVDTTYDGKGRTKQVSNPYRSGGSPIWATKSYDGLDRLALVTNVDGSTVQYAYSFNKTTVTDEAANARRYTYNVLGQMTQVEEPNPTLSNPLVTTYTYYGFGPLYRSNQGGQLRTWAYNWLGQMISQTLPESGATTFAYDNDGRMTSKTDARNITTTMTYDNADRLSQRSYSDGTSTVTFGYDASGQTGLRTSMTDALGSVSYTHDTMNRLTQESRTLTGVTGTFSTGYVYNIKGDITQMTYPSGRVVNFNYATGGGCCNSRLSSVVDQTTGITMANSLSYNAAGETLARTLNPGTDAVVESFTYNNRLQLTQIKATKGTTDVMDFTYNYGASSTNTGRVLSRTDAIQSEHSAQYAYDSIYRLSQVIGSDRLGIAWGFDVWGNRLTQTPQGLASSKVGSQTRGYTNNRDTGNTYDAAGNQTNDGSHTYAVDAENRIKTMDATAAAYGYDGEGRRMKKTVGSETTYTFYGLPGILGEFTTTSTGATVAASTDKPVYRTSDKLGTAVLLIAANGAAMENNRTLPYGEAWLSEVASTNKNKFTTYERDSESNLDYAMARYSSFAQARFASVDSGATAPFLPKSLNRYVYASNDPVNKTDPTGNDFFIDGLSPNPPFSQCIDINVLDPFSGGGGCFNVPVAGIWYAPGFEPEPEPQRAPSCDVTEFTDGIGGYSAADLNATVAVIMGEGTGLSFAGRYGIDNIADEYIAIASVVFNRAQLSGRSVTYEASQRTDSLGRLQFQGYTSGANQMAALQSGNTNYFIPSSAGLRRNDPNGVGAFQFACEKFRMSKNIVASLAGGSPGFSYTYFNQTPGPGRVQHAAHWFRTGTFP